MSLAFALMAAINGSTGSSATLSHGLKRPHQASPASVRRPSRFSFLMGGGASGRGRCRTNQSKPGASIGRWEKLASSASFEALFRSGRGLE